MKSFKIICFVADRSLETDVKKVYFCALVFTFLFAVACGGSKNGQTSGERMYIAPYNHSVAVLCDAESKEENAAYQWYESSDASNSSGTAVQGATDRIFTTPIYAEKGIHYYYCTATSGGKTAVSEVSIVAYTALPTLYINTPNSVDITSNEDWLDEATISVVGAKDDDWNFESIKTSIRGKGKAAWERPKKPYVLKLEDGKKIMGMPKNKRWILLANYRDRSFMRNVAALYLSELFELDWTAHGEFVDLVLNGKYKGLYWFGETVRVGEDRVNISDGDEDIENEDDKDYLLEAEESSESVLSFKTAVHGITYTIQNDDYMFGKNEQLSTGGKGRVERLSSKINVLEQLLYPDFKEGMNTNDCSAPNEAYTSMLEIDSWIKFWLVNEIMDNKKLETPESCYFTFESEKYSFKAGPVWDFETASVYQQSSCRLQNTLYYDALFKSPAFVSRTTELWKTYSGKMKVDDEIESMRTTLSTAAQYDSMLWGNESNDPSGVNRKDFNAYVDFLKETLNKKISVVNKFIENS